MNLLISKCYLFSLSAAGVPVHIMEVLHPPSEDSSDNQQLMSRLNVRSSI